MSQRVRWSARPMSTEPPERATSVRQGNWCLVALGPVPKATQ